MTEALITELAKIGALTVISRTSVMQCGGHEAVAADCAQLNVGDRSRCGASDPVAEYDHGTARRCQIRSASMGGDV